VTTSANLLVALLQEAWTAVAGTLVLLGLLTVLYQVLRGAGSAVIGSRNGFASAIGAVIGTSFVLLFAFLGLPALADAAGAVIGESGGCGPLVELGAAAAGLIAALAAVRMLVGAARSLSDAVASGEAGARALLEAGEAVLGMLAAVLAGPVAGHFLGAC
jgi:hypothetical protein